MTRRNYPLTALRAFEAAARHLSFAEAANELHVTPAAISQQIKTLEDYLDVQLFIRHPNHLQLTNVAILLLPKLSAGFMHIDQAIDEIVGDAASDQLTISAAPVFTAKWLSPRLDKFNAEHPDINLHVSSSLTNIDFNRDAIDVAIRLGAEDMVGLDKIDLFEEQLVPMCSPTLLKNSGGIQSAEELGSFTLIHDDSLERFLGLPGWQAWFEKYANENVNWSDGPHFSQPDHAAQSAMDGAGFILGWEYMSSFDLANKRLVIPFNLSLPLGFKFSLVYPTANAHKKKIIAFKKWLCKEV